MDINIIYCDNKEKIYKKIKDDFFIIDGANIAYHIRDSQKKPQLKNIILIKEKLDSLEIKNYYIICDRSLNYTINEKKNYRKLVKNNIIVESPEGTKADIFILQIAQSKNAFIVSNDIFRNYYELFSKDWIERRRISFKIIDNDIFFNSLIKIPLD